MHDEIDPWPCCGACQYGMHKFCLALTVDVWCSCVCGWLWPDGQPDRFWTAPLDLAAVT